MIRHITCVVVDCDGCGSPVEDADDYVVHHPSWSEALRWIRDSTACGGNEKAQWCSDCMEETHTFLEKDALSMYHRFDDVCARCSKIRADHPEPIEAQLW